MLGTKCPSMTSMWIRSAPAFSASATSAPRRAKSAARMEGASFTPSPRKSCILLELAVTSNQVIGRTVVREFGLFLALQFRNDPLREHLAEFHTPLIERVDIPDHALGKDAVLIQRHQFAERSRRQSLHKKRVRRPVALEQPVRDQPIRSAFRLHL